MAQNPKDNLEKIQRMLTAWETLAPDKSFGGMTLAQFRAAAQPALDARQRLETIEEQRAEAIIERDRADDAFLDKAQLVVAGVLADPEEGPDGALYKGFGYKTRSDRASGLTHKSSKKRPTE